MPHCNKEFRGSLSAVGETVADESRLVVAGLPSTCTIRLGSRRGHLDGRDPFWKPGRRRIVSVGTSSEKQKFQFHHTLPLYQMEPNQTARQLQDRAQTCLKKPGASLAPNSGLALGMEEPQALYR